MTRRAFAGALIAAIGVYAPAAMTHGDKRQRIDYSQAEENLSAALPIQTRRIARSGST